MQLGALHLQGKVVGAAPLVDLPGSPLRPLIAGEEFTSNHASLDAAIAAARAWTAGPARPGALIIGGRGKFEAYALDAAASGVFTAGPFHFEGAAAGRWPRHALPEGVAFVDGDTVIRR